MHRTALHNKNYPDQKGNSAKIEKSCSRTTPNAANETILPYFPLISEKKQKTNKQTKACQTGPPQTWKLDREKSLVCDLRQLILPV